MDNFTILAIALGLSFDTFAVSLSLGVVRNRILFWQAAEIAILLAIFQGGSYNTGIFSRINYLQCPESNRSLGSIAAALLPGSQDDY